MAAEQAKEVVRGALLLTFAGLFSKVLSAIYRVPLQNLTGDLGFYLYQQVYPLIGIASILALYGYPVAIAKIVAIRRQKALAIDFYHVYGPLIVIMLIFNGFVAGFIFLFGPWLAMLIDDPNLATTFQIAAFLFILLPPLALLRGVSQGYKQMKPTAYSQMAEQFVRVALIVISAYLIYTGNLDVGRIGTAGAIASLLGMGMATLMWLFFKPKVHMNKGTKKPAVIPWGFYMRICFSLGIVAALSHMVLLLLQLVDVLTLVPSLMEYGLFQVDAMKTKGVFDRGQPLIQFGVVIGSSFALALVPSVVEGSKARITAIREAMLISFYIATGACIGLVVLMPEVNQLLYTNTAGTTSLQVLAFAIVFSSVSITACSVLQSMGQIKRVALLILLSFAVKWGLNVLLVPHLHIIGSAFSTIISLLMLMVSVGWLLQRELPELHLTKQIKWGTLTLASLSMAVYLIGVKFLILLVLDGSRFSLSGLVLFLVCSGTGIYLLILLRFHAFSNQQIQALPFGARLYILKLSIEKKKGDKNDEPN
jgi:PST family polysaccharide transporter